MSYLSAESETKQTSKRTNVVGVRFTKLGKLYHFRIGPWTSLKVGDFVIVETKRGPQMGQVILFVSDEEALKRNKGMRTVERQATPRDLVLKQVWEGKNLESLIACRERAHQLGIQGVKFINAQYNYEGSWLTIFYSADDPKTSLGELAHLLSQQLNTRVELQIIGPREVAKMLGGYGACGGPRCCSTFLVEFSPVTVKMAKEQGVPITSSEITGMCGRLRCCLIYEYEQYVEAKKELPALRKRVGTPYGQGVVLDVHVLRESVRVRLDGEEGEIKEVFRHEIEPLAELKALQEKAAAGCSKHEGGGCDCGAKKGVSADEEERDQSADSFVTVTPEEVHGAIVEDEIEISFDDEDALLD